MMIFKSHFYIYAFLSSIIMLIGCTDNDMPIKDREEEKPPITDEENPSLPPNENTEVALFNILNLNPDWVLLNRCMKLVMILLL